MRRVGLPAVFLATALVVGLTGCHSSPSRDRALVVFAAASLNPAFTQIAERFRADNPGVDVKINFGGSSDLAAQLTQGATADVFASADAAQMDKVAKAGLPAADPATFAANTLVIVTAPGNPKHVQSFADLAAPGLHVVVCQRPVPCGAATARVAEISGVRLHPVSEEPSVTDALNKVTSGQADAALVYVTDALDAGSKVATVRIPEAARAVNTYSVAVLKNASQPALARKFAATVTGQAGQQILDRAGFVKP